MLSWPSPALRLPTRAREGGDTQLGRRARPAPPDSARGPPAAGRAGVDHPGHAGLRVGLVTMASTPSGPRQARTLPPTRTAIAAGELGRTQYRAQGHDNRIHDGLQRAGPATCADHLLQPGDARGYPALCGAPSGTAGEAADSNLLERPRRGHLGSTEPSRVVGVILGSRTTAALARPPSGSSTNPAPRSGGGSDARRTTAPSQQFMVSPSTSHRNADTGSPLNSATAIRNIPAGAIGGPGGVEERSRGTGEASTLCRWRPAVSRRPADLPRPLRGPMVPRRCANRTLRRVLDRIPARMVASPRLRSSRRVVVSCGAMILGGCPVPLTRELRRHNIRPLHGGCTTRYVTLQARASRSKPTAAAAARAGIIGTRGRGQRGTGQPRPGQGDGSVKQLGTAVNTAIACDRH